MASQVLYFSDVFYFYPRECREAKNLSQQDLAKPMKTSYTVIDKYERDEMIPSIEVGKNLAKFLDTTVGYLLGESKETNGFIISTI